MAKEDVKEKEAQEGPKGIDPKWLKGLKWAGSEPKEVVENGKKKTKYIPFDRPLEPADVMSFRDQGASVVIATTDGRKYIVKKEK